MRKGGTRSGASSPRRANSDMILDGRSQGIAATLDISVKTVTTHRSRLIKKLGLDPTWAFSVTRAEWQTASDGVRSSRVSVIVGTSGYSYKEWKGIFYPELFRRRDASFYATHLGSVEINNTFYGCPRRDSREVGRDGRTTSRCHQAPQRITPQTLAASRTSAPPPRVASFSPKLGPFLFHCLRICAPGVGKRVRCSPGARERRVAPGAQRSCSPRDVRVLEAHDQLCVCPTR